MSYNDTRKGLYLSTHLNTIYKQTTKRGGQNMTMRDTLTDIAVTCMMARVGEFGSGTALDRIMESLRPYISEETMRRALGDVGSGVASFGEPLQADIDN